MFFITHNYLVKFSAVVLFCLCPLAFFIPRGAVIILTMGGLLGWFYQGSKALELLKIPFSLTFISLIFWIGLSSLWAPLPLDTFCLTLRLVALFLLGIGWTSFIQSRSTSDLSILKRGLLYGIILSIILIAVDAFLGNPWQHYWQKSSAKAFVPLVLTVSIALWPCLNVIEGKLRSSLIVVCIVGALLTVDCDTAVAAIICGGIVMVIYRVFPMFTTKSIKLGAIFLILGLPWLFLGTLTDLVIKDFNQSIRSLSYVHRLYVWQFVSHKITEKSLIGYGGDSSRAALVGGEQKIWSVINNNGDTLSIRSKAIPLHPHNLPLQIWLELGAIGALMVAALSYFLLRDINHYPVKDDAIFIGCFTAASFIFLVNLGCWQSWWLAVVTLVIPLLSPLAPNKTET